MKKDTIRDYIIEAFRLYARLGEPEFEKTKQAVYNYALTSRKHRELLGTSAYRISKPTEAAAETAERIMRYYSGELADISAVCKTLETLKKRSSSFDASDILREVYFKNAHLPLKKNDIQSRVINASIKHHISETTAYRSLRNARNTFAYHRGLFVPDDKFASIEEIVS